MSKEKFSLQKLMDLISKESKLRIAQQHVTLYEERLASNKPHVNIHESEGYLSIWRNAVARLAVADMPRVAMDELCDYLATGETLGLTPEEAAAVKEYLETCSYEED
jgi:hypothetical protein